MLVVDDLVPDVDGRTVDIQRPFNDVDCPHDARTKAPWLRYHDSHLSLGHWISPTAPKSLPAQRGSQPPVRVTGEAWFCVGGSLANRHHSGNDLWPSSGETARCAPKGAFVRHMRIGSRRSTLPVDGDPRVHGGGVSTLRHSGAKGLTDPLRRWAAGPRTSPNFSGPDEGGGPARRQCRWRRLHLGLRRRTRMPLDPCRCKGRKDRSGFGVPGDDQDSGR